MHELNDDQRRSCNMPRDVTYGTNNEFGFDYLRDNMKYSMAEMVQRGHYYAIVDEVDSILIDEARTPLIISGPLDDRSELYNSIDTFIPKLDKSDYELDEKTRVVTLTEAGNEHVERLLDRGRHAQGRLALRHRERQRRAPRATGRCAPIPCSSATAITSSRTTR